MLETKLEAFEQRVDQAANTIGEFSAELKLVRRQAERITRYAKPALWLISAALIQGTGGNVLKLSGLLLKSLAGVL